MIWSIASPKLVILSFQSFWIVNTRTKLSVPIFSSIVAWKYISVLLQVYKDLSVKDLQSYRMRLGNGLYIHAHFWSRIAFGGGFKNNLRGAHGINMLKAFLENIPGLIRDFLFDDWLVLVRDKLWYHAWYFAHGLIILFLAIYHCIYENIWRELCNGKSFFCKALLDAFKGRFLPPSDCLFAFLLPKFTHYVQFLF